MNDDLAFLICTECGPLESMSIQLALSLRNLGGELKDAPIYSFTRARRFEISRRTKEFFNRLHVEHQSQNLNREFYHYALANKVCVANYAEQNLDHDILVFLDSDQIVVAEPTLLRPTADFDVTARPVEGGGISTGGPDDPEYDYWQKLYEVCGVSEPTYVESVVDEKSIFAYWNSGLVAVRREAGLFRRWYGNFVKVMRQGLRPKSGLFFVEQSTLAATFTAAKAHVLTLPNTYNYPISNHDRMPGSKKIHALADMVTLHYHTMFRQPAANPLAPFFTDHEKDWEISQWLDESGLYPKTKWGRLLKTIRLREATWMLRMKKLIDSDPTWCRHLAYQIRTPGIPVANGQKTTLRNRNAE